ncbi:MAG: sigma-70 family RNA polymerase sigma factor [Chthonomonas sp.]|nr:sigma-70 family RNA polymerase sigma factor [Chthonomonas sp.]
MTAFELIVDQYRAMVYAHALRLLASREDAMDVTQETMIKAFRALPKFQVGRPLQPWLLRICTNCAMDLLRTRRVRTADLEACEFQLADNAPGAEAQLEAEFQGDLIRRAVNRLPRLYRKIISMRHFEEMEISEIAERLCRPEGTIKSWLFRARGRLRQELQAMA